MFLSVCTFLYMSVCMCLNVSVCMYMLLSGVHAPVFTFESVCSLAMAVYNVSVCLTQHLKMNILDVACFSHVIVRLCTFASLV